MKNKLPIDDPGCAGGFAEASCRLPVEKPEDAPCPVQIVNRKSKIINGFTLIELLTVIVIIGVLAAFILPGLSRVKRRQYISHTQAEMGQLQAAIDSYHSAYGFYPPDNPGNPLTNQLYYELVGTTNTSAPNVSPAVFQTLDRSLTIDSGQLTSAFGGVSAFVNCSKFGANEEARSAQNFLHELRPNQTMTFNGATLLVASVGGVDSSYQPLNSSGLNPWRYVSPGVNNPNSYDLYVQIVIGGQTNLICNWSKEVQINSPLP